MTTFIQLLKPLLMLVDSRITLFKNHIKRIESLECRKLGIKSKMSLLSEPVVLRFSVDLRSSKYRGMTFHSLKLERQIVQTFGILTQKEKKNPKTKPLVFLDHISFFPPVFMLHNQCNWEERCGILSRDNWICGSSIICSLWSSVEISASLTKVTRQGMDMIFSSCILQTCILGQMLMRAVDLIQLT